MNPWRTWRDGYQWLVNPYQLLDEALQQHGLTFRVRLPVLGNVLMTGDPALIAEIVHHPALDAGKAMSALRAILGERSLIMLDGETHRARHRLASSLFRGDMLAAHDDLTIRVTQDILEALPRGQSFSAYEIARQIELKVMVAAMFGQDSGVLAEAEAAVASFLNSFRNPLILFVRFLRVDAGPWSPWGRAVRNRLVLCDLIGREIRVQRQHPRMTSLLGRLVTQADNLLSDADMVEEVLSLLLFGHDTAAASMAWVFAHIYQDAALVDRLRCELGPTSQPSPRDDHRAPSLLLACIQESLRLCPVVVHLSRVATADLKIGDYAVKRGDKVIPCTYLAQHNPGVFPDPAVFRPERFVNGQRYEHAYFPFGFGSRLCVGKPWAMRQMLLVLGTALRTVDLELCPGYRPTPVRHLVLMVPRAGTLMRRR